MYNLSSRSGGDCLGNTHEKAVYASFDEKRFVRLIVGHGAQ
jgi:hypothetical protein